MTPAKYSYERVRPTPLRHHAIICSHVGHVGRVSKNLKHVCVRGMSVRSVYFLLYGHGLLSYSYRVSY